MFAKQKKTEESSNHYSRGHPVSTIYSTCTCNKHTLLLFGIEVRTAAATALAARSCAATPRQWPAPASCSSIFVSRRLRCRAGVSTSSGYALALVPGLPRLDLAATEGKGAGWGGRATVRHLRECLSVCVSVCVRELAHVHRCT